MNDVTKKLMAKLGDAINETLSTSDRIAAVISEIKAEGHDVYLVLEATVGLHDSDVRHTANMRPNLSKPSKVPPALKLNAHDARFLKSLKIKTED